MRAQRTFVDARFDLALLFGIGLASSKYCYSFEIGVTHTAKDWGKWNDAASVDRAVALLKEGVITWQSQGVVGSGGMWLPSKMPPSTPGAYDWSALDYRVQAMRNASYLTGRLVLRLFCAPTWMASPTSTSPCKEVAPDHFDDFAIFCGQVAARYPDVGHFLVWNEMDGFYRGSNWHSGCPNITMDGPNYTSLFNKVAVAVRAQNPTAKVGGPYVPISLAQCAPGTPGEVSGPWGAVNPGVLSFIRYFVEHAAGNYDFFALDGHLAYKQVRINGTAYKMPATKDPRNATDIFPAITAWVRKKSGLPANIPIWWSEMYPVPCHDTTAYGPTDKVWSVKEQIAVYTKAMQEISAPELGVQVFLNWGAQVNNNCFAAMYNDTSVSHGGYPTLFYNVARRFNHHPDGNTKTRELTDTRECALTTTTTLAVTPDGDGPLRTLDAALAAARVLPYPRNVSITIATPVGSTTTAAVRLRRGVTLTARDSCLRILGVAASKSTRNSNPASDHLRMDNVVPLSALSRVADDNPRVHSSARGHIYRVDLGALNVTHAQAWPDTFTQGDPVTRTLGVFWQGRRLTFARSPKASEVIEPPADCSRGCENKGSCKGGIPMRAAIAGTSTGWRRGEHKTPASFALYNSEVPRVTGWTSAIPHGLYLLGNWRVDFVVSGGRVVSVAADDPNNATVNFASAISNGIGWKYNKSETGCGCEPFYALNALELITEPLEYALDVVDEALYVYLPRAPKAGELTVVDSAEPMISIGNGAHSITIEGLRLGFSYGGGIVVAGGARHVQLLGCVVHDIGGDAIEVRARDTLVRSNDIYNSGGGGIVVAVNDNQAYKTLRQSNVTVRNNHLHHIGYLGIAFGVGISLVNGTTGATVSHNLIHHVSGKGLHGGHRTSSGARYANQGQFANTVEYNEVFQVGLNGSGFGAMYTCCGPVDAAGTVFRYNFVHSSPAVNAIAWDNQLSGQQAYGNVIYYTQNGFGLNHGSFNAMQNNLIIANAAKGGITSFQADAAISTACMGFSDVYNCTLPAWAPWAAELQAVRINDSSSAWGSQFGWYLEGICAAIATRDGENQRITGISATNNAVIYIDSAYSNHGCNAEGSSQNNTYGPTFQLLRNTSIDPGFADYRRLNLTLLPSSPVYKALPTFKAIPFNDIGLEIDTWRKRIPSDGETGRLVLAPGKPGGPPAPRFTS